MILAIFSFICTKLMPGIKLISIPNTLFISMTQQYNLGLGQLTVDFSRSHTIKHTYTR